MSVTEYLGIALTISNPSLELPLRVTSSSCKVPLVTAQTSLSWNYMHLECSVAYRGPLRGHSSERNRLGGRSGPLKDESFKGSSQFNECKSQTNIPFCFSYALLKFKTNRSACGPIICTGFPITHLQSQPTSRKWLWHNSNGQWSTQGFCPGKLGLVRSVGLLWGDSEVLNPITWVGKCSLTLTLTLTLLWGDAEVLNQIPE